MLERRQTRMPNKWVSRVATLRGLIIACFLYRGVSDVSGLKQRSGRLGTLGRCGRCHVPSQFLGNYAHAVVPLPQWTRGHGLRVACVHKHRTARFMPTKHFLVGSRTELRMCNHFTLSLPTRVPSRASCSRLHMRCNLHKTFHYFQNIHYFLHNSNLLTTDNHHTTYYRSMLDRLAALPSKVRSQVMSPRSSWSATVRRIFL